MRATPHLCSEPGCPNIVEGAGRCPEHRRGHDSFAGVASPVYGSSRWRRLAAYVRQRDRPCRVCQLAPAAEAHHLDHAKPGDAGFWNPARIVGVCTPCHRRLTGERSAQLSGGRADLGRAWRHGGGPDRRPRARGGALEPTTTGRAAESDTPTTRSAADVEVDQPIERSPWVGRVLSVR